MLASARARAELRDVASKAGKVGAEPVDPLAERGGDRVHHPVLELPHRHLQVVLQRARRRRLKYALVAACALGAACTLGAAYTLAAAWPARSSPTRRWRHPDRR